LSLRYKEARPKLVGLKSEKKSSSSYVGRKFVQRSHTGNHHLTKKLKEKETPYSVPENLRILAVWTKFPVHLNLTAVLVGFMLVVLSNYKSLHF
jgi:hypothetical protein